MTEYNHKNCSYTDLTDKDIPKDSVLKMLFEGTSASGEPATEYEVNNIESATSREIPELEIQDVVVRESDEDNDLVVFEVRTPSVTVTAPHNATDYDTRVCHEEDIPYHYYDVSVLN